MNASLDSIGRTLENVALKHAPQPAIVCPQDRRLITYAGLIKEIDAVARGFLAMGIQIGERVAIWAPNAPEWIIAFLGVVRLGAVAVPIDPGAAKENLNYILGQSESTALVIPGRESPKFRELSAEARREIPFLKHIVAMPGERLSQTIAWEELVSGGERYSYEDLRAVADAVTAHDPMAIMYTSGTTGLPKGVVLNHIGLINKSLHATQRQGITSDDRLCLFFPLFHMFGNTCIALAGLLRGAALVMPGGSFAPAPILKTIATEKCTAIYGSPSMLIALVDDPQFHASDWATVKKGIIGGSPCPMELMRRIVEEIGVSDITVAWGITEASSWITMTMPQDPIERRVATIGKPLPCCEVKIVEPKTGEALPAGRQGELCTRGYLMKEYYKMPAATVAAVDREGWFHTGDLGEMDADGYVKITGRLKDVIARGGLDIYPVEVEEIIYCLADVSEVQVFGFQHPQRGPEVAAWIKLKTDARLSIEEVEAHVNQRLSPAKRPRFYKFVQSFPMTGSGKIQKYKLAEMAQREYLD
jgi:fatty-acyl-CoA synthase